MENQRIAPEDLTDGNPDHDSGTDTATGVTKTDAARETIAVRRPRGREAWLVRGVAAAAVLFVGSAAFAGAEVQPYLADRAAAAIRIEVARTAAAAITTLWTYSPDTIETLPDRAASYLSGDFDAQYRTFLQATVTPNKQAQVTDKTNVVGVAVESLKGSDADALVLTNTTATSPLTKNIPSTKYVAYRLTMKRQGSRWLVNKMATISFLDMTPQI